MIATVLLLPSAPALLPPLSQDDPVVDLRKACREAVAALPAEGQLVVVAVPTDDANRRRGVDEPLGHRVARQLLGDRVFVPELALPWTAASLIEQSPPGPHPLPPTTVVVLADGSARRSEKAPGHLHPHAVEFDDGVERALREGDAETLALLDPDLGEELWCTGTPGLRLMGEIARGRTVAADVSYAEAPYGVAWWVARWGLT